MPLTSTLTVYYEQYKSKYNEQYKSEYYEQYKNISE